MTHLVNNGQDGPHVPQAGPEAAQVREVDNAGHGCLPHRTLRVCHQGDEANEATAVLAANLREIAEAGPLKS